MYQNPFERFDESPEGQPFQQQFFPAPPGPGPGGFPGSPGGFPGSGPGFPGGGPGGFPGGGGPGGFLEVPEADLVEDLEAIRKCQWDHP